MTRMDGSLHPCVGNIISSTVMLGGGIWAGAEALELWELLGPASVCSHSSPSPLTVHHVMTLIPHVLWSSQPPEQ